MNKENAWDQKTEIDIVEKCNKKMKLGKASRLLEVSMEMINAINASGKVGIDVMMKLCQRVLDRKGIPEDWKTSANIQGKRICDKL